MATTSQRIKEALNIRGMKQADLVEKTGIGKSSISTYISGEYNPKQKNLYKIAKALHVNEAWLMGLDVPMNIEEYNKKWDEEAKIFMDKTNAFEAQLKSLGWTYEHYGCYERYRFDVIGLSEDENGNEIEVLPEQLLGCNGKKCSDCPENEQYYLFTNNKISFKVSIEDFNLFINDSQIFFKNRIQELLQKTMDNMFAEEPLLNAAHARTDIDIPEDADTSEDDIMDDENF